MDRVDFKPVAFPRWLRQADECKAAALELSQSHPELCAFWCQQALERLLKAFLVKRGLAFENNITDLKVLVDLCGKVDSKFLSVASASLLNQMGAWETAYQYPPEPGEPEPGSPSLSDLKEAGIVFERLRELVTGDAR